MTKKELEKKVGKFPCEGCPAKCVYDLHPDGIGYDAQIYSNVRDEVEKRPEQCIHWIPDFLKRLKMCVIKAPNFATYTDCFDFLVCRQLHLKENFTELKGEEIEAGI